MLAKQSQQPFSIANSRISKAEVQSAFLRETDLNPLDIEV
jgi:hypothetical protein